MDNSALFPKIPTVSQGAGNWRPFTGDGTPFLQVPGLKKLKNLKVGTTIVPMSIKESYPTDAADNLVNQEVHDVPLLNVDKLEDGTAVIVRSIKSNDGIWQKDVTVYVDGDWEASKAPATEGA